MQFKNLGWFSIGLSVGLFICSIIIDYMNSKPVDDEGDIEVIHEKKSSKDISSENSVEKPNNIDTAPKSSIDLNSFEHDALSAAKKYNGYFDMVNEDDLAGMEHPQDDGEEETGVKLITMEEYDQAIPLHDKLDLIYYVQDDVLTDDSDIVIPDTVNVIGEIGEDFINERGMNLPPVFYVRNYDMGADYEVTVDKRSYEEIVLGIPNLDDERSGPRKMREHDD